MIIVFSSLAVCLTDHTLVPCISPQMNTTPEIANHHTSYIIHTSYIVHHTPYIIHHTPYIIHYTSAYMCLCVSSTQEQIFEECSRPVVQSILNGYNGTDISTYAYIIHHTSYNIHHTYTHTRIHTHTHTHHTHTHIHPSHIHHTHHTHRCSSITSTLTVKMQCDRDEFLFIFVAPIERDFLPYCMYV